MYEVGRNIWQAVPRQRRDGVVARVEAAAPRRAPRHKHHVGRAHHLHRALVHPQVLVPRSAGPAAYCSPRQSISFSEGTRAQDELDDVAGNIYQDLP